MTFQTLGLSETILKAISEKGYREPTPIQAQTIPVIIQGRDLMGCAQTGTGKTAGFVLPILQKLVGKTAPSNQRIRALILAPTRELAAQIYDNVVTYGRHERISAAAVYGGVSIRPQIMRLRRGADILVATPGRLLDLYRQGAFKFSDVEVLVLDEADRMLDMGFIHDIKHIISLLPENRQSLLFSATISDSVRHLAQGFLKNPAVISVNEQNSTATTVTQQVYPADKSRKSNLLTHLIKTQSWYQALVFCRTKHGANKLSKHLEDEGIRSSAIQLILLRVVSILISFLS
jgi:ATP-dependent RNA helicase RhlE